MKAPSTPETNPAASAGAELLKFTFNAAGVCTDAEEIAVLSRKIKGCQLTLFIAQNEAGEWCSGFRGDNDKKKGVSSPCAAPFFATRGEALKAALRAGGKLFVHHEAAMAQIESYYDSILIASSVTTPAGVAAVTVAAVTDKPAGLRPGRFAVLPIAAISRNPDQPRKTFDPVALQELATALRQVGQLQPVAVRKLTGAELGEIPAVSAAAPAERYELILGERRWRAVQLNATADNNEAATIECKVYEGVTRAEAKAAALVENIQRVDLNPIEEAEAYRDLMAAENLTQEACAVRVGRSRPVIANALRVLELPAEVLELISQKKLSLAHGVALAKFKGFPEAVAIMAIEASRQGLPASHLEKGVPFDYDLVNVHELAVRINGWDSIKLPKALQKHPSYFACENKVDWICLEPAHWAAEKAKILAERDAEQKERDASEAALAAKALKKKKLKLSELSRNDYVETGSATLKTIPGLVRLVPDAQRATALDYDGKREVEICTDKKFVDKLAQSAKREMKKDRTEKLPALTEECVAKIKAIKKLGAREIAWLIAHAVDAQGDQFGVAFDERAAERQGVKLPVVADADIHLATWATMMGLAEVDQVQCVRVLMDEHLEHCLTTIVELGVETDQVEFVRWLLNREELGFLEENTGGQKLILSRVKESPWYVRDTATELPLEKSA